MHLGSKQVVLSKSMQDIYGKKFINRRFRCRYGFDTKYLNIFRDFEWSGSDICSLKEKLFYHGVQYHPEFTSSIDNPDPVFVSFFKAAHSVSSLN